MNKPFDPKLTEEELMEILSKKEFRKIGIGSSAYVFGDTEKDIVLKIFPPLSIGNPEDISFIDKRLFLRYADIVTGRWQNLKAIKWIRQKAKSIIAYSLSQRPENIEERKKSCEICINGYEISILKGLFKGLPTRVISNCVSTLSLNTSRRLMKYLEQPEKIVVQKFFHEESVLSNVLKLYAKRGDIVSCRKLIKDAVKFQIYLWRNRLTNTDMSFDMFDNLIILQDGNLQIHDVNGINDSLRISIWYIREKEKDISKIFERINRGEYPQFIYKTNSKGIAETARKLYSLLPKDNRDDLTMYFLELCKDILSERIMITNWNSRV